MPLLSAGFAEARPTLSVFRDLRGEGLGLTERFAGHLACMADIGRAVVFLLGVLLTFAAGGSASEAAGAAAGRLKPAPVAGFGQYGKLADAAKKEELLRVTNA